jgi:glycosyltransferase involved in cell wall biosynthesis
MPKVSVIIPTYNRASVVQEAIQSVLDQTYTDYEVIVVDDGSTDNTRRAILDLTEHGRKVRYVYQRHRGRSAARNLGLRWARGEYIAFLDSDDRFLPHKLHVQVSALKENPDFGMAYCSTLEMDKRGHTLEADSHSRTSLSGWIYPELLFIKGTIIKTPSVMVRADILSEIGSFDETMDVCEDLDLWRRIARRYKILQIEEPLTMVRSKNYDPSILPEKVAARILFYEKAIIEDPDLEKSIQSKLFSEMYCHYGVEALAHSNTQVAFHLLMHSIRSDISQFVRSGRSFLFAFVRSRGALVLQRCLPPEYYYRLRNIYRSSTGRNENVEPGGYSTTSLGRD